MAVWIWGIVLLLIIFCLSLYIKVDVAISIREEDALQGVSLKIHSRFYKMNRQYNYTDQKLHLIESFLISHFYKSQDPPQTTDITLHDDMEYPSILKGPIRNFVKFSMKNKKILGSVLSFLIVDRLEWKSVVGSQDAFYTALETGACWAFKGVIIGVLSSRCRLGRLMLDVKPDFITPALLSNITCILKMRTVHIIIIEISIIAIKVRWCIDGIRARTVQTSH